MPEGGNGAVDPVQVADPLALLHGRRPANRGQRGAGQVLKSRAAVQQQDLADGGDEAFGSTLVAPFAEQRKDLPDSGVDRGLAEDPMGERGPVEASDLLERGEAAEEIGVGDHEWTRVRADLTAPPTPEIGPGPVGQADPVLVRPAPVTAAEFTAADQNQASRVAGEPSLVASARRPLEAIPGVGQRLDQPARSRLRRQAQASELLDLQLAERFRLGAGHQGSPVVMGQVERPWPAGRPPAVAGGLGGRRRHRPFTPPGCPTLVSMSMRQEWICCIPRFNLSARSRPDRGM